MRRLAPVLALAALLLTPALARAAGAPGRSAVLVFLPQTHHKHPSANRPSLLDELTARNQLSLGLVQASQGGYYAQQTYLDIGQGARVSATTYSPSHPPGLPYVGLGGRGFLFGWPDVLARAESAPANVVPALLSRSIPGGIGYAATPAGDQAEAIVAADRDGVVRDVSLGPARTLAKRTRGLLGDHRLVVVSLPEHRRGLHALDGILGARRAGEEVIVVQTPPAGRSTQLLPMGMVGGPAAAGDAGTVSSGSTRRRGMVAAIDLAPTILRHLGIAIPRDMTGQPISVHAGRDEDALTGMEDRLEVTLPRRTPALEVTGAAWLLLVLLFGLIGEERGKRLGLRLGGLALFWLPATALIPAAVHPSFTAEMAIIVGGAFLLALLTDRFVGWPRGPAVPAFATLAAYTVDLALGSPLIAQSVFGPNPRSGSRFFGIGNELESVLPIMLFVALAALLPRKGSATRRAWLFGVCGAALAIVVGSGRLGADVGGVITISVGTVVAAIVLLSAGRPSRRAIALAVVTPVVALGALAALDLLTGANSHYTRDFIETGGAGSRLDVISRKLELAANNLTNVGTALVTVIALLAALYAIRYRHRIFGALYDAPAWRAAFIGGLAGAVAGALTNDSGPVLLIAGVVVLATLTPYVRSAPLPVVGAEPQPEPESEPVPGTALRPPEPARVGAAHASDRV